VQRPRLKRLAQQALRTADRASELLPKVLDRIEETVGDMKGKELIGAGSLLERLSAQRGLVAKAAGLSKFAEGSSGPQTIVNINLRPELPLSERLRLIQQEVAGIPRVEAVLVVPEPQSLPEPLQAPVARPEPPDVPEVPPTPENAPRDLLDRLEDA
jgi:hypothetical protein